MVDVTLVAVCLVVLGVAAYYDFRSHRIPNRVVLAGLLSAVALNTLLAAGIGGWSSLAGLGLGLALMLPFYLLRALGAGDVKLIAVVGAFLGPLALLGALLAIGLTGGLLAVAVAWRLGVLRRVLENVRLLFIGVLFKAATGTLPTLDPLPAPTARMPYGVAIALGTVAYLAWLNFTGGQS